MVHSVGGIIVDGGNFDWTRISQIDSPCITEPEPSYWDWVLGEGGS